MELNLESIRHINAYWLHLHGESFKALGHEPVTSRQTLGATMNVAKCQGLVIEATSGPFLILSGQDFKGFNIHRLLCTAGSRAPRLGTTTPATVSDLLPLGYCGH
ncbi:hypothetical protein TNCV_2612371 [Trichonephila clavipes]|nr:hypothetical protein TNCV_2612371 [Trichonephila clavipes]